MSWCIPTISSPQDVPFGRASHASVLISNDRMFTWGGDDGAGSLFNDGFFLDGMYFSTDSNSVTANNLHLHIYHANFRLYNAKLSIVSSVQLLKTFASKLLKENQILI